MGIDISNDGRLSPSNGIFGLPPSSYVSDDMILNSMPIMEITPGVPELLVGQTLFKIKNAWTEYNKLLANNGFMITTTPIKLAFIADNFPTDTFTNDYGETFLQKFTDVASEGMSQISQMTGSRTGTESLGKFEEWGGKAEKELGGTMGTIAGAFGSGAGGLKRALDSLQTSTAGTTFAEVGTMVNKLIAGHRVDFPMIWRNSGFTPSYSATVRLYNPNPSNERSTKKYIIGPLAVILCLGLPQSDDGKTYSWPFFHKIESKGIYNLNPAVITNITIIKGGDQQQIAYNQRLGMVDVRIDFGSLYTSMVAESEGEQGLNIPTLKKYLTNLEPNDDSLYRTRNQMTHRSAILAAATEKGKPVVSVASIISQQARQNQIARNDSIRRRKPQTVLATAQSTRVPTETKATETQLTNETSPGFLAENEDLNVVV